MADGLNLIPVAEIGDVSEASSSAPRAFHVMIKPRGPICNLDCSYCFYLRKEALFEKDASFRMSDEVLEEFTRQYIEAQNVPQVTFGWQGGEPTLMGLDFFRKAVDLQRKYTPPGMDVHNSLQTNGVLLDEEWCEFLRENSFLVGLSLDGPKELHDANRVDKGGKPTFDRVLRTLKLMQRMGVEHNVLCLVNSVNSLRPRDVYRFYRDQGVQFIQFIPAVERLEGGGVTEWTVRAKKWGSFLIGVFDEWVSQDVGSVFVQHFDLALEAWAGLEPSVCVHARTCGDAMAIEHTGDMFSCDHFVRPDYYLGNIREKSIQALAGSSFQRKFGKDKDIALPPYCKECDVRFACNGGCPKDRFISTPAGEPGLNYLCEGYLMFYRHIAPYMREMAELLRRQQPPSLVMRQFEEKASSSVQIGRNDPCPCGSGRKYKHCCLNKR